MKHIVKSQTKPCSNAILTFIQDKKSRKEVAHYDGFPEKETLRVSLLQEQGFICAYCTQRIANDPLRAKIEHWKTREAYNKEGNEEGTLDYDNLFAVCVGDSFGEKHCDSSRAENNPELTLKPTDKRLLQQIKYLKNGRMESVNSLINKDLDDPKHLNLNLLALQDNRKKALNDIRSAFDLCCKGKNPDQAQRLKSKIVQQFIEKDKGGHFRPYCEIVRFFYKK